MALRAEPRARLEFWVPELTMRPTELNSQQTGCPEASLTTAPSGCSLDGVSWATRACLSLVRIDNEAHYLHLQPPQTTFWKIFCIRRRHGTRHCVSALYVLRVLQSARFGTVLQCCLSRHCMPTQPRAVFASHETPTQKLTLWTCCFGRWWDSPPTSACTLNRKKKQHTMHPWKHFLEPQGHHMGWGQNAA